MISEEFIMNKILLLLLPISLLAIAGCNKNDPTPEPKPIPPESDDDFNRVFEYDSKLVEGQRYSIDIHYLTSDFQGNNAEFNKNLAINSLASAIASRNPTVGNKFFTDLKFDNFYASKDYSEPEEPENIAYVFACKDLGDKKLVAVSMRGLEYATKEVFDNFNIGEVGEHLGFKSATNKVLASLETYINQDELKDKNIVYWISGYSRAGAVASLASAAIADEIVTSNKYRTASTDMFTYTFEAPNHSIREETYGFIHNIINRYDVITYVPPTEMGFRRLGNDVDVTNRDVCDLMNSYYEGANIKAFEYKVTSVPEEEGGDPVETDIDPIEFYHRVITFILNDLKSDDGTIAIVTRADFAKLLTFDVGEMKVLFTNENLEKFKTYYESLGSYGYLIIMSDLLSAIRSTTNEDALYEALSKHLVNAGIDLPVESQDAVKETCKTLQKVANHLMTTKDEYGQTFFEYVAGASDNFDFVYSMHLPETVYVLLNNYEK